MHERLDQKFLLASMPGCPFIGLTVSQISALRESLQICALLVGIAGGLLSMWMAGRSSRIREQKERIERQQAQGILCAACRHGNVPGKCPIPPEDRPANCRLRKKTNGST